MDTTGTEHTGRDAALLDALARDVEGRRIDTVEEAALAYVHYAELARVANRGLRRAEKVLNGYDPGNYGDVRLYLAVANREYIDKDAVAKIFAERGLGPVPMKGAEPKLKVELVSRPRGTEAST